jgi:thiamine transport system substrate-binding protein
MKYARIFGHLSFFVAVFSIMAGCDSKSRTEPQVTVLTYSGLGAKNGFLQTVAADFKKQSGCSLKIETTLGATQMISVLEDAKLRHELDVVMGVDELLYERLRPYLNVSEPMEHDLKEKVIPALVTRLKPGLIPLDFGAMSFVYRKSEFINQKGIPRSRRDLNGPLLKKKFILQDPRASSPGMVFFLFMNPILKPAQLKSSWLTLAPNWDSSYKMFLAKDAPMVWSYVSSLAYHASKGELNDYGVVEFEEGLPVQIEGMAVIQKNSDSAGSGGRSKPVSNPCIQSWIDFVMKPAVLEKLAQKQWMLPAMKGVPLPPFFDRLPPLKKIAEFPFDVQALDRLLTHFGKDLQGESF